MILPRGPMVLIRRLKQGEEKTKGGITIPKIAAQAMFKGEIVALGDGIPCDGNPEGLRPFGLKIGDVVLVQDDPPMTDPRAAMMSRKLVPVSATEDLYLVNEAYIYAVDNPPVKGN